MFSPRFRLGGAVVAGLLCAAAPAALPAPPAVEAAREVLKARCIACHGPAKREAGLDLSHPETLAAPLVAPGSPAGSRLWRRVAAGEMPPGEPLPRAERAALYRWLAAPAPGRPAAPGQHWAFRPLRAPALPAVRDARHAPTPLDRFLQARLEAAGLAPAPEADRHTLIRRVAFAVTGLPPTPEEIAAFLADASPRAYEAMVERYLASPHYGERWGAHWLDAAGYADSNGYFNADTDRPLAYRYRDWVVRAVAADKPWDRFVREQLAGDQIAGYVPGAPVTPEQAALLEATHFLRNSPDGTDSSDGNPDERRADKYAVLEGTAQIIGTSLLGLTVQCARCHDHKFEPFTQRDYYALQALLAPAFPIEKWVPPAQREFQTASREELAAWEAAGREVDARVAALRREFADWARANREPAVLVFEDGFDGGDLGTAWSNTVPGDDAPAGNPPVTVGGAAAPAARLDGGRLRLLESGAAGDRALSTRRVFDWTPETEGAWVQATFDLVEGAPYVGFFVALRDFNDRTGAAGGNVLLDGAAMGGAAVHVDYPGADSRGAGRIGKSGYAPGRNYGVRITRRGGGYELAQVVDGVPEEGVATLGAADLPDGAFGFEYCCGRSFAVDNVRVETSDGRPEAAAAVRARAEALRQRRAALETAVKAAEAARPPRPGRVAGVSDLPDAAAEAPFLERGEYKHPRDPVRAAPPAFLGGAPLPPAEGPGGTGVRRAFAEWLTRPGTAQAALLARVTVNRWWQGYFGTPLVATPDNLGLSGARPSHPELLEYLAHRLAAGGWSAKALHREILLSAAFRRRSDAPAVLTARDPDNRLYGRFPAHRLDAEAIRDAMLAASGELDRRVGGPYVPTVRTGDGDVVVREETDGARRRSLYLQRRRTQVPGVLEVFDAPSIVFNCTQRTRTTVPLQSLKLLNSAFTRARAAALAERARREAGAGVESRLERAFLLAYGRPPRAEERAAATAFLARQPAEYEKHPNPEEAAWTDLCQMLLSSNPFLYVE